jgi:hypothetical protein
MLKGDIILVYNKMLGGFVIMEVTEEQKGARPYRAVIVDAEADRWRQDVTRWDAPPQQWYVSIDQVVDILEEA